MVKVTNERQRFKIFDVTSEESTSLIHTLQMTFRCFIEQAQKTKLVDLPLLLLKQAGNGLSRHSAQGF